MEACRGAMDKCSSNLGVGVKCQSSADIAGSSRNWPKSSLEGDVLCGRDTDRRFRGRNPSVFCQTPNA